MSINNRIFGTPITGSVRAKLQKRQETGDEIQFGQPVVVGNKSINVNIPKDAELSSRTPFTRMWTSVKVIDPAVRLETQMEQSSVQVNGKLDHDASIKKLRELIDTQSKYNQSSVNALIVPIYDTNITTNPKPIIGYGIFDTREQIDYIRKIYIVGDHTYQEKYGTVDENKTDILGSPILAGVYEEYVPQELKDNPLLKPQSGITSVRSETMGPFGITKQTVVNFTVHNFYDYDRIYSKYFLRPGATIFVDFGWNDIEILYSPDKLITSPSIQGYLYGTQGQLTKYEGDLEVIQGIVTDYNAKVLPNGSVECSVTLTSSNSALLNFPTNDDVIMKVKQWLTRGILYLGLQEIVVQDDPNDKDNDLAELSATPDPNSSSAIDIQTYNRNIATLAAKELSGKTGPTENSIRTGVFVENLNSDNSYIAFGLFEDLIINSNFGFGNDISNINKGNNLQVKMDSTYSFTRWNKLFLEKQHVLFQVPEESPTFVFPLWWGEGPPYATNLGSTQSNKTNSQNAGLKGSYSYQNGKFPVDQYDVDALKTTQTNYNAAANQTQMPNSPPTVRQVNLDFHGHDQKINRIPLREVFINTEIIIEAMEQNSDVRSMLKQILDSINESSEGLFDWQLKLGDKDSELKVIDGNYNKNIEDLITVQSQGEELFTFNIMSPNSIVKDYNLEFKLPQGNIGNMYAIQAMSHGNNLFSVDMDVDKAVAIQSVDDNALSIIYEPDLGTHRVEALLDRANDIEAYDIYSDVKKMIDTDVYKANVVEAPGLLKANLSSKDAFGEDVTIQYGKIKDKKSIRDDDARIKKNDKTLSVRGYKVANNFTDYYKIKTVAEEVIKKRPNLLPFALSLTTYGIGSIIPGDTFKVDYLPEMYQKNTFVQTTKVINEINSNGWYTTLDTQFRLIPNRKITTYQKVDNDNVRLSPLTLSRLGFGTMDSTTELKQDYSNGVAGNTKRAWASWITTFGFTNSEYDYFQFKFEMFAGFMTNCRIKYTANTNIDYEIRFHTTSDVKKMFKDSTKKTNGIFNNRETMLQCKLITDDGIDDYKKAISQVLDTYGATNTTKIGNLTNPRRLEVMFVDVKQDNNKIKYTDSVTVTSGYVNIVPSREYSMLVKGNKFVILDPFTIDLPPVGYTSLELARKQYNKQKKVFEKFAGVTDLRKKT